MYKEYLKSLHYSIRQVRDAVSEDVNLSFLEQFDYDFKRELLYQVTGFKRYREGIFKRFNNIDYRVASFAAVCFDQIMGLYLHGSYSFRDLKDMASSYCSTAWLKGITSCRYSTVHWDENNVLYIDLMRDNLVVYSFEMDSLESSIYNLIHMVSFLISEGYNKGYREKIEVYLTSIFNAIEDGERSEPFVDMDKERRTLETYLRGAKKLPKKSRGSKSSSNNSKVIPYKKAIG